MIDRVLDVVMPVAVLPLYLTSLVGAASWYAVLYPLTLAQEALR